MNSDIVYIENGQVWTDSVRLAKKFGKKHKNVLQSIDSVLVDIEDENYHRLNFQPMYRHVDIGNGAEKQSKFYRLSKEGFLVAALGFTGRKALAFRIEIVKQFFEMEQQLVAIGLRHPIDVTTLEAEIDHRKQNAAHAAKEDGAFSWIIKKCCPNITRLALGEFKESKRHYPNWDEIRDTGWITQFLKEEHGLRKDFVLVPDDAQHRTRHAFNWADVLHVETQLATETRAVV